MNHYPVESLPFTAGQLVWVSSQSLTSLQALVTSELGFNFPTHDLESAMTDGGWRRECGPADHLEFLLHQFFVVYIGQGTADWRSTDGMFSGANGTE